MSLCFPHWRSRSAPPSWRHGMGLRCWRWQAECAEYVEDGSNGLLAARPDADLFSAGMLRLLSEEPLRMRLGREARGTMKNDFQQPAWWRTQFAFTKTCSEKKRYEPAWPRNRHELEICRKCFPGKIEAPGISSGSARRFSPSLNFCHQFLLSLVPGVSLLSARRFTSAILGLNYPSAFWLEKLHPMAKPWPCSGWQ